MSETVQFPLAEGGSVSMPVSPNLTLSGDRPDEILLAQLLWTTQTQSKILENHSLLLQGVQQALVVQQTEQREVSHKLDQMRLEFMNHINAIQRELEISIESSKNTFKKHNTTLYGDDGRGGLVRNSTITWFVLTCLGVSIVPLLSKFIMATVRSFATMPAP